MKFSDKLDKLAKRPATFSKEEIDERNRIMTRFDHISAFEGLVPDDEDLKLHQLYAEGKVTDQEYMDLCMEQINHNRNEGDSKKESV